MFEILQAYFERNGTLTSEEINFMRSVVLPKQLKKGDFLIREGEVPRHGAFVCKGFLRSYFVDNKGKEHVVQFAPENWWISARPGVVQDAPSSVFIDAIEDSDVFLVDHAAHTSLMQRVPLYASSFLAGIQRRGEAKEQRIVHSLAATAEERYNDFIKTYPSIAQRVPQHMLASYLGITPETVSRIRRKALTKK
jgi:CRP-like cAMP-binding protein